MKRSKLKKGSSDEMWRFLLQVIDNTCRKSRNPPRAYVRTLVQGTPTQYIMSDILDNDAAAPLSVKTQSSPGIKTRSLRW
jgi:hypothetical protein